MSDKPQIALLEERTKPFQIWKWLNDIETAVSLMPGCDHFIDDSVVLAEINKDKTEAESRILRE
jgi:hypothetical protein